MAIVGKKLFKFIFCPGFRYSSHTICPKYDEFFCTKTIHDVLREDKRYGFHSSFFAKLIKQKILIEFSSPNIAKEFHVGHYRSTMVGAVLSNLLQAAGHDIYRMNYLGDWGMQFAMVYVGCQLNNTTKLFNESGALSALNRAYVVATEAAKNNPEVKSKVRDVFHKLEKNDPELVEFWTKCRCVSIDNYKRFYEHLGIKFDEFSGESYYRDGSDEVVERCRALGILINDECGNLKMSLGQSEKYASLRRSDGTSLYMTRDILAAIDRHARLKFDRMIYVTDIAQKHHFSTLFASLQALGYEWACENGRLQHCTFGRVKNMKSRTGDVQLIGDIFEATEQAIKLDRLNHLTHKSDANEDHVARVLSLTGLLTHDLGRAIHKDYAFSWDKVLATKGNSGLFIQYTHCRLCSLEAKCGPVVNTLVDIDAIIHNNVEMVKLLKLINRFSLVVERSYKQLEPSHIINFLYDLSHAISRALRSSKVKGNLDQQQAEAYLLCFHAARIVVGNGLRILGIEPLDKM